MRLYIIVMAKLPTGTTVSAYTIATDDGSTVLIDPGQPLAPAGARPWARARNCTSSASWDGSGCARTISALLTGIELVASGAHGPGHQAVLARLSEPDPPHLGLLALDELVRGRYLWYNNKVRA